MGEKSSLEWNQYRRKQRHQKEKDRLPMLSARPLDPTRTSQLCEPIDFLWVWARVNFIYVLFFSFFKKRFYLFIFREGKGRRKRGRETSMCGCLSYTPYWGPGPQPRHVPWLGIELATLWFTGPHSIHWATPARAYLCSYCEMVIQGIDTEVAESQRDKLFLGY